MQNRTKFTYLFIALFGLVLGAHTVSATTITVTIGADDGFGGFTGTSPGDPVGTSVVVSGPAFSTPVATDETNRLSPNALLTLNYGFALDTSGLTSISSAQVLIRMASVGLGTDNGFGDADVSFDGNSLGKLRPGGLVGSAEVIQEFTFDVTAFVSAGVSSTLTFSLDGTGITGGSAGDFFMVDLASLEVQGDSVGIPEPGSLALFGLGLAGLGYARRKRAG
ncbi:MAG: hypothetical protein CMM52_04975 [Rhodospirillaceae bacterium]|nr:hypothetical protein [Rhodospirillaceae bacterium]|tara:strand:- start:670 stop:1335 length:666 start_codon:yes stop_codon:yes gene_type:complete